MTVARLDAGDLARDVAVSEEDLKHAYDARAGEFDQPERRTLQQMVLRDEETAKKAAAALARGADFAKTAVEIAKMDAAAVDLGALARTRCPPIGRGFSLPRTPSRRWFAAGWHIVKVVGTRRLARWPSSRPMTQDVARDKASTAWWPRPLRGRAGGGAAIEDAAQGVGARSSRRGHRRAGLNPDGKPRPRPACRPPIFSPRSPSPRPRKAKAR